MSVTERARHLLLAWFSVALAIALAIALPTTGFPENAVTTIYIVRHAEKKVLAAAEKEPPGPGLTQAGVKRAIVLKEMLKDVGLDAIYVSNYRRTQETAEPTATETKLKAQQLGSAKAIVEDILKNHIGQTVLVVGHSNTVDDIGKDLGVTIPTLGEKQFDRLFVVRRAGDKVELELRRYGEQSPE
ncbi:SixA phosphatase family protein [Rhizobium johnstonii]|uniref:SixA phosphatase family protein n=1 Tax=Rhizobium johnstonii TaxID=3019933 RepID=UPI003F94E5D2